MEIANALWQHTEHYMDVDLETWEDEFWAQRAMQVRDEEYWRELKMMITEPDFFGLHALLDVERILIDGEPPSVVVDEALPVMQSHLDDLFDQ